MDHFRVRRFAGAIVGAVALLAAGIPPAQAHHVKYNSIEVTGATVDMSTGVVTYTGVITCTAPVWAFPYGFTGQDLGASHRASRTEVRSEGVRCPGLQGARFTAVSWHHNFVTETDDAWFYPGPVNVGLWAENCPYFDPDDGTSDCLLVSTTAQLQILPDRSPSSTGSGDRR